MTHTMADTDEILKELWTLESKSFFSFSLDKADDGFTIQLVFQEINPKKLEEFILKLNNSPHIKEIHWSR